MDGLTEQLGRFASIAVEGLQFNIQFWTRDRKGWVDIDVWRDQRSGRWNALVGSEPDGYRGEVYGVASSETAIRDAADGLQRHREHIAKQHKIIDDKMRELEKLL